MKAVIILDQNHVKTKYVKKYIKKIKLRIVLCVFDAFSALIEQELTKWDYNILLPTASHRDAICSNFFKNTVDGQKMVF